MSNPFATAFDHPTYVKTLSWLGKPIVTEFDAVISRPFHSLYHDLRGSWPYQSMPGVDQIARIAQSTDALSYTFVLRPDIDEKCFQTNVEKIRAVFTTDVRELKAHLGHVPDRTAARSQYSERTILRLIEAEKIFQVEREPIASSCAQLSVWQDRIAVLRQIPRTSSPDSAHFKGLATAEHSENMETAAMTLRWRRSGNLAGVFLLFRGTDGSWHAHSFLVEPEAMKSHGTHILFDQSVNQFGAQPIWFGGAPAGPSGQGVFQFKKRFSNISRPARIVSVDLDTHRLAKVRAEFGTHAWLPNYRNPAAENSPVEPDRVTFSHDGAVSP